MIIAALKSICLSEVTRAGELMATKDEFTHKHCEGIPDLNPHANFNTLNRLCTANNKSNAARFFFVSRATCPARYAITFCGAITSPGIKTW